jgi:protein-L-isoaspartate(D-aspartate) O-methyltransferase
MMPLDLRRRFYAEEIEAAANLTSASLVDALATVPREQFLRPGPWTVRSESDFTSGPRQTPDSDPRHIYHNLAVALDPARQLFNGAPSVVAMVIDRLALQAGDRVVHVGCGTGYYTAVMAHCVGASGKVTAIDVDAALAAEAGANLASLPWVDVQHGDGRTIDGGLDAVLVNAGVTHPLDSWLDALRPGGRLALPLTVAMSSSIGKGLLLLLTRASDGNEFAARVLGLVAIYNAIGLRDAAAGQQLAVALKKQPMVSLTRLRRDAHDALPTCWLHRDGLCLSTA